MALDFFLKLCIWHPLSPFIFSNLIFSCSDEDIAAIMLNKMFKLTCRALVLPVKHLAFFLSLWSYCKLNVLTRGGPFFKCSPIKVYCLWKLKLVFFILFTLAFTFVRPSWQKAIFSHFMYAYCLQVMHNVFFLCKMIKKTVRQSINLK